jgi:hypothetical protein
VGGPWLQSLSERGFYHADDDGDDDDGDMNAMKIILMMATMILIMRLAQWESA